MTKPMHCWLASHLASQSATSLQPLLSIFVSQPSEGPFRFLFGVMLYPVSAFALPAAAAKVIIANFIVKGVWRRGTALEAGRKKAGGVKV